MGGQIHRLKRAGSYDAFVRRYEPLDGPDGSIMREWNDPDVLKAFDEGRFHYVWTLVMGDTGERLYIVPGFATVNYMQRVLCAKPWPDEEQDNTGYLW
jgi:hypothetical protein